MQNSKGLNVFILVMFITGSIDSIRNLPATALFGTNLIFFFSLAALIFLLPTALISAELSASWSKESGVYHWVRHAFGEHIGFLAIWLQWINTMIWYPTILSFIAGTIAFIFDPHLADSKLYLVTIILVTFWTLTLFNLKGINTSAKFASFCAIVGMIIPMLLIISLASIWLLSGHPLQLHISPHNLLPKLTEFHNWISLTAIITSFLGIELATVHVRNVKRPQVTFPKAMLYSTILILCTMIFGSLAIAFVVPQDKIRLVDGIMQAFTAFFSAYHLSWLLPVITVMLVIGSIGGMINWIVSPAKGLLQAAEHGFLPKFFQHRNSHGVASHLLISQAVLVSLACISFIVMPTVNASYWLLTDLSTQLYVMMYLIMFAAAITMRVKFPTMPRPFQLPGKQYGTFVLAGLGIIGCCITLYVGFFPPDVINVGGLLHYETIFSSGILVLLIPVAIIYLYRYITIQPSI